MSFPGDFEVVEIPQDTAHVPIVDTAQSTHRAPPYAESATGVHPPEQSTEPPFSLRAWAVRFMDVSSDAFVREALGVSDPVATHAATGLLRDLVSVPQVGVAEGAHSPHDVARDARVAGALVGHYARFRDTIRKANKVNEADTNDVRRVHGQWSARVQTLGEDRRSDVRGALATQRDAFNKSLRGGGGSDLAGSNAAAPLSNRIMMRMQGCQTGTSLRPTDSFTNDRIRELDHEVQPMLTRKLEHHERDELLHLLRRRSELVRRINTESAAAIRGGGLQGGGGQGGGLQGGAHGTTSAATGGPVSAAHQDDLRQLGEARGLEAGLAEVDAVRWRLRDTLGRLVEECYTAINTQYRRTLEGARLSAIRGFDRDLNDIDTCTQRNLARIHEHGLHEQMPIAADAGGSVGSLGELRTKLGNELLHAN